MVQRQIRHPTCGLRLHHAAVLIAAVSCSDSGTGPPDGPYDEVVRSALIVSDAASAAAGSGPAAFDETVTWVSLPPGTIDQITRVRIRNLTAGGAALEVTPVEGGFDPVPLAANDGDELELAFYDEDGLVFIARDKVPGRRPPVVVRTSPPRGRTDVALSIHPTIVFSEPIDATTLTTASVRLEDGGVVGGTILRHEDQPWTVTFTPAESLAPGTQYELVVTQAVRDLDGDALDAEYRFEFTTAGNTAPAAIAFVSDRGGMGLDQIYVAAADGSGVRRLIDGWNPTWSPDGRWIAFERLPQPCCGGGTGIWVIGVDGSGLKQLAIGMTPDWSPDGDRIAYHDWYGGIWVMNADGSDKHLLVPANVGDWRTLESADVGWIRNPAWSPDGTKLAFVRVGKTPWQLWVANADGTEPRRISNGTHLDDDDSGATVVLTRTSGYPSWSPDGSRIIVSTLDRTMPSGGFSIVSFDVDGLRGVQTIFQPANGHIGRMTWIGRPIWLPDDRLLIEQYAGPPMVEGADGSRLRIFAVTPATGETIQLIPDDPNPVLEGYMDYNVAWRRP